MTRIPRFSPSFSTRELLAAMGAMRHPTDRQAVRRFEEAFASYIGVKHAVMVASARMGAYLVLKAWGVGVGDEVLLPAFTYFSIPSILLPLGVTPVFVDIDPETYLMDPKDLERKITPRSKVVIPTHLYGFPCPMDPILKLAWSSGLKVLEDCAQATGAKYQGKRLGSFGDATYYTFGLTKNITTLRGGMVSTDDAEVAAWLRHEVAKHAPIAIKPVLKEVAIGTAMMAVTDPRVYPFTLHPANALAQRLTGRDVLHEAFEETEVLYESEPSWFRTSAPLGIQGEVGLVQLGRLDGLNEMRASHGQYLLNHLSNVPGLTIPKMVEGAEPIFMSFPVQVSDRKRVARKLLQQGVDSTFGYMKDCSRLPLFQNRTRGECPAAALVESQILHLPVHPNLNRKALNDIAEAVRRALHQ